jgi:hypothetical protein
MLLLTGKAARNAFAAQLIEENAPSIDFDQARLFRVLSKAYGVPVHDA